MAKYLYAYKRPLGLTDAEIIELGREWGIKDFGPHSHEFFADVAPTRRVAGKDYTPNRTQLFAKLLKKGDVLGFPRADLAGADVLDVRAVCLAAFKIGAAVYEIESKTHVQPEGAAMLVFEDSAKANFAQGRTRARMAGKARTGNFGGRPATYTAEQMVLVAAIWLPAGRGSVRQRALEAGARLKLPDKILPQSNMRRWFDCEAGAGRPGRNAHPHIKTWWNRLQREQRAKPKRRAKR